MSRQIVSQVMVTDDITGASVTLDAGSAEATSAVQTVNIVVSATTEETTGTGRSKKTQTVITETLEEFTGDVSEATLSAIVALLNGDTEAMRELLRPVSTTRKPGDPETKLARKWAVNHPELLPSGVKVGTNGRLAPEILPLYKLWAASQATQNAAQSGKPTASNNGTDAGNANAGNGHAAS